MQVDTGKIQMLEEEQLKNKKLMKKFVRFDNKDMTDRQREEMQVSKFDNRSKLGKIFREERAKKRKAQKESRRRNRK